jgi:hypothetical protein
MRRAYPVKGNLHGKKDFFRGMQMFNARDKKRRETGAETENHSSHENSS